MNTKELGLNIQKARKERGLTQIELAKKIDKSKRTLQHYEAGTVNIPLDVLSKIEDALDVPFVKPRIRKNDNYKTFIDFLETININVTETTDGFFVSCDDISEDKTYKFTILAPEYLCDVLRLVRMSDYVRLRDQYGRVYNADTFLITPQWQTQGNLASVEVEYQTDTVVKKLGYGYTPQDTGDYNSDFNNDFNNQ